MFKDRAEIWLWVVILALGVSTFGNNAFTKGICDKNCALMSEYCLTKADGSCNLDNCYRWVQKMGDQEVLVQSCWQCGAANQGEGNDGYCIGGNFYLVCKKKTSVIAWRKTGVCDNQCDPSIKVAGMYVPASTTFATTVTGPDTLYLCDERTSK